MRRGTVLMMGLSRTTSILGDIKVTLQGAGPHEHKQAKRAAKRRVVPPATNLKQERRRLSRVCVLNEGLPNNFASDVEVETSSNNVNTLKTMSFASSKELARWLKANHAIESELWVKIFKKQSGVPSVTWDDVVVECLCWGWIDGVRKGAGDDFYIQRITPRRVRSNWSKRNRCHVEQLISEGRMQEAGLHHVHAAKKDGRWENAYSVSEMEVPADFLAALKGVPKAQKFFKTLTKSSRSVIAHGLLSAKKPETRQRRFAKFMDMLLQEQTATFFK